jgi:hypothetical protein
MPEDPSGDFQRFKQSFEELQREMEQLLGYPRGAFDPSGIFFKDVERVNRALGGGFKLFQELLPPALLSKRVRKLHPDERQRG